MAINRCQSKKQCDNWGRYLTADGQYLCGLCSMGKVSVRILDLPLFIALTHSLLGQVELLHPEADELRTLLMSGRR